MKRILIVIESLLAVLVCGGLLGCTCGSRGCAGDTAAAGGAAGGCAACTCEKAAPGADGFVPSHVVATETAIYKNGPQQAMPPDGIFAPGTRVTLVEEAGSYSLVRAEDGREGYVSAGALQPAAE